MSVNKRKGYPPSTYVPDRCNRNPVDMGTSFLFGDFFPGANNTTVRPFGWTEYEGAYRPQYVVDPCVRRKPCRDPCVPKGVEKKFPPRQFVNKGRYPRSNICQLCRSAKCRCNIPPPWEECKEKIVVYDPDSVRTLFVHGEVKNEHPFVLANSDYERIMNNAILKDKKAQEEECLRLAKEKQDAIARCREKADDLRLYDQHALNDSISPEAREDMGEILCRAEAILKEDEPEVRTINTVILAAKVQAIREAQLEEKELIKCEQAEEERRLVELMKQDMEFALMKDDTKECEEEVQKKRDLALSIRAQMDEHEAMKFFCKEMKAKEAEELKEIFEKYTLEDIEAKKLRCERKVKLGVELIQDQMAAVERMRLEKEMDKELDLKMVEFQKQKAAEEERLERERSELKKQKEIAVRLAGESQKRAQDAKAFRDELRAKRHQEQQEREWRRREREELERRRERAESIKEAIMDQMQSKRDWMAEQAAFDKAAYDKIFEIQDTRLEEDLREKEERKLKNLQHGCELLEQIHGYRLGKIKERKDYYVDGIQCRRDLAAREQELRCAMDRKLGELRESCMPEKYLRYVEKTVEQELRPDWMKKISK